MNPEEIAEKEAAAAVAKAEEEAAKAPSQENKRSEKEKAEFTLKKVAEQVAKLGGNPAETLNIRPQINLDKELDDSTPLTVGNFRELQKKDAFKTSLQLADELPEDERAEVKDLLENNIRPSGNAEADLRLARAAVNATRNAQIAEHISNRVAPKRTAAGGSADAGTEQFVPTPDEARFMQKPYNLSKDKILAARKIAQAKQQ